MEADELLAEYRQGRRDFSRVVLEGACLDGADLREVVLRDARLLERTTLRGANLSGAQLWDVVAENSDLEEAQLCRAALVRADLAGAGLKKANLRFSGLLRADLAGVDMRGAELCGASAARASFISTNCEGTDFRNADLGEAVLQGAMLRGATFDRVRLGSTVFADVDLSGLCEAQGLVHTDQSAVDFRSVARSIKAPGLRTFLRQTGMPRVFADYMIDCARSLDPQELFSMMRSTFISYGGPDEDFAKRLHAELSHAGVTTFFFPEHAIPGDDLQAVMRCGVNEHDRIVVVCSEASLTRPGVLNEIKESFRREAKAGGTNYVIPVVVDDHLFSAATGNPENVVDRLQERVVADFRDPEAFDESLAKLLRALRKSETSAPQVG